MGEGTSAYSDRGTRSFHMYNRLVPQPGMNTASGPGGHSEIQDAYNYILPDEYWGYQGASSCNTTYSTAPGLRGCVWRRRLVCGGYRRALEFRVHDRERLSIHLRSGAKFLGIATTHNTIGIDNSAQAFYAFNTFTVTPTRSLAVSSSTRTRGSEHVTIPDEQYLPSVWPRAFRAKQHHPVERQLASVLTPARRSDSMATH